jgi:NAD(P)-dependent dehydrogenase (short-subunit alcohol dehydrogenase family)
MPELVGRTALITGAGSGLGAAVVRRFVGEGANVIVVDRNKSRIVALEHEFGARLRGIVGDLREPEVSEQAVATTLDTFGRLDAVVATAGITDYQPEFTKYDRSKLLAAFREIMDVNVASSVLLATAACDALKETNGSLTFTLSTSGTYPGGQGAVYSASKAALTMVVKQLAYELAPRVRVNGVIPGVIAESSLSGAEALGQSSLVPASAFPGLVESAAQLSPLRLCPSGAAYAGLYVLLANPIDGAVATGSIINWDTGIGLIGHGGKFDEPMGVGIQ